MRTGADERSLTAVGVPVRADDSGPAGPWAPQRWRLPEPGTPGTRSGRLPRHPGRVHPGAAPPQLHGAHRWLNWEGQT